MKDVIQINKDGSQTFHGNVAQKLGASKMNTNALRTNATLRKEEWKEYDQAIVKAAKKRMVGIGHLYAAGQVFRTKGLGKTVLEYEQLGEMAPALMSMDGRRKSTEDRATFAIKALPLPITHHDYTINARTLASSRTTGDSLDVTQAAESAAQVADFSENMLFNGANGYTLGGTSGALYGYTDFPERNTVALALDWTHATKTGENIVDDVLGMKQALIDDRRYGPYVLYVPTNWEVILDADHKAQGTRTIRERLLAIKNISRVEVSDHLSASNAVLVEMDDATVRMVEGLPLTNVEWDSEGGMAHHFKVMQILIPQIRTDKNGRCGIAHLAV